MFSYDDYRKIISFVRQSGNYTSFHALRENPGAHERFVLMRHDVEFSVDRAYDLAVLEDHENFHSSYFFQLTNNTYNLLSLKNRVLVKKILALGHTVGLHFHLNGLSDLKTIKAQIKKEVDVMSDFLGFKVDCFSIHRPPVDILRSNITIPGLINTYGDQFFSFTENMEGNPPEIKYISDARHQWNYGLKPDKETILSHDKIQILTHPYSWTEKGYDNFNNFKTLVEEKQKELKETIDRECKHFAAIRDALP